jgi:hypothetical protein
MKIFFFFEKSTALQDHRRLEDISVWQKGSAQITFLSFHGCRNGDDGGQTSGYRMA